MWAVRSAILSWNWISWSMLILVDLQYIANFAIRGYHKYWSSRIRSSAANGRTEKGPTLPFSNGRNRKRHFKGLEITWKLPGMPKIMELRKWNLTFKGYNERISQIRRRNHRGRKSMKLSHRKQLLKLVKTRFFQKPCNQTIQE